MSDCFGKETPKLGFGLTRLPHKGIVTDVKQTSQMVDRYPRDHFMLATKLNAPVPALSEASAKKQLYTSLERTGAVYFDCHLLHALMQNNYTKYGVFHIRDFVKEQKKGPIKHFGILAVSNRLFGYCSAAMMLSITP